MSVDYLHMEGDEMAAEKGVFVGGATMLVLGLLSHRDMYGYEMIEELSSRSQNIFAFKTGTLYPLLHSLQREGLLESYEQQAKEGRVRKYYRITKMGRKALEEQKTQWDGYTKAVNRVMKGGTQHA